MATIATHNGSAVHQDHNKRDVRVVSKEPHIDPNGSHETWHHESVRDAYDRIFSDTVKEYNDRQTREDRQIEDYLSKIEGDAKKHPAYELIVGVYGSGLSANEDKAIMREYVDTWAERNPSLELIGAYYHADEQGQAHVHIDYIPIIRDCSRGMSLQTGLNSALRQQGIEGHGRSNTAQMQWQRLENVTLERLCRDRGITIDHPQSKEHARERSTHLDTAVYKVSQQEKALKHDVDSLNRDIDRYNQKVGEIDKLYEYMDKVADFCRNVGMTEHDYHVHEYYADRGDREHLPPEISNPDRTEQERADILHDLEERTDRDELSHQR